MYMNINITPPHTHTCTHTHAHTHAHTHICTHKRRTHKTIVPFYLHSCILSSRAAVNEATNLLLALSFSKREAAKALLFSSSLISDLYSNNHK